MNKNIYDKEAITIKQQNYAARYFPNHQAEERFLVVYDDEQGRKMSVTTRDVSGKRGYYHHFPKLENIIETSPKLTITELGTGLGELPYYIAQRNLEHKIIIVDPINYITVISLLERLQPKIKSVEDTERLQRLILRAEIVSSFAGISHIPLKLDDALFQYNSLISKSDVVVDLFGPAFWSHYERKYPTEIIQAERRLVKHGGWHFVVPALISMKLN